MKQKNEKSPYEKASDFFWNLRHKREYIQTLIRQTEELDAFLVGVKSALSNAGGGSSGRSDPDGRKIKGILDLEKVRTLLIKEIDEYGQQRADANRIILKIDDPSEKRVLLLYYFPKTFSDGHEPLFRTWDEVAAEMHCDEKTARNYRRKGLYSFAKIAYSRSEK